MPPPYKFSHHSALEWATLEYWLQKICSSVIQVVDYKILIGHREKAAQDKAYADGFSGLKWPNSFHNTMPSYALDFTPFPLPLDFLHMTPYDIERYYHIAGVFKGVAHEKMVDIVWGGDWARKDLGHIQLARKVNEAP